MDQRPNRPLFLVLLLLVCLPLYSSLPIQPSNETFLAPTSGPIKDSAPTYKSLPLLQDSTGIYYIDVTWKNASSTPFLLSDSDTSDFNDSSDEPAANAGKMVLALYTNISFVTICTNFLEYDCSSLDCQINSLRPIDQSYLLSGTEIEGYSIDVGVESPAFSMCGYSVIYAMTCGVGYPMQMSGYLGMGFSLNAFFEVNRNFSIFLSNGNDNLNSTLFIGSDDDSDLIDSSSNYMQSWLTDKDWTVFVTSVNAQAAGQPGSLSAGVLVANHSRALFDINTNAIGMAYDLFNNLSSILEEYGVTCTKSPYQPSCTYDGEVKSLPTFYLNLEDQNGTAIEINPEVYFVENAGQDTSYTLMFAAMASGIPGALQVSPKYENAIILGRPFMTYYYVHFSVSENYKQPSVTVYLAQHDSTTQTSNLKMILIIVGSVLGVVIVIGVGAFIFIRRRRKSQMRNRIQAEEDRPTVTTVAASNRKEAEKSVEASLKLKQPLLNASSDTSRDFIETTKKEKEKVWNNNGFVDPDEMNACTYKKQNYRGLYESESDSLSLNDEIGAASR